MEAPEKRRAPRQHPVPQGQLGLDALAPAPGRPLDGRYGAEPSDTELAAAGRQAQGGRRTQRVRVLDWLEAYPDGGTDHEISVALGIVRPHVAGTRREELIRDGHMIVDAGERRPTDTGSPAIVWKLIRF